MSDSFETVIDLNKTLLRCPHCHGMPVAVYVGEPIKNGNQIKNKVRCYDCSKEYWVTWDESKTHVLSAEEELALQGRKHRLKEFLISNLEIKEVTATTPTEAPPKPKPAPPRRPPRPPKEAPPETK